MVEESLGVSVCDHPAGTPGSCSLVTAPRACSIKHDERLMSLNVLNPAIVISGVKMKVQGQILLYCMWLHSGFYFQRYSTHSLLWLIPPSLPVPCSLTA